MQIFKRDNIKSGVARQSVATIGFFDGVHRGHRFLIDEVKTQAENRNMDAMVVTFPLSPSHILNPQSCQQFLTTAEEKIRLLHAAGIDQVVMLPFTRDLSLLSASDFMSFVKDELKVSVLVMGYDHRFGKKTDDEDVDYVELGRGLGVKVLRCTPFSLDSNDSDKIVSSSAIRDALLRGDVEKANLGLGYDYSMEGPVVSGHQVGVQIGYPTANISVDEHKLVPANGVYAVNVIMEDGVLRNGMLNIGRRPTLDNGNDRSIEVNIFDFDGDLYGKTLRIELRRFIRPESKFDSLEDLKRQLETDRASIKALIDE